MKARGAMNSFDRKDWFFVNKQIGIQQAGNLNRSPEIRETTTVQKAIFPVFFYVSYEHENEIDWFDTVGYEGVVTGASDGPLEISDTVSASDT